jgi:hypothetical protein
VTGSFRCKNEFVSVFFKTFFPPGAVLAYSELLESDKTAPHSLRVVLNQSHRKLDEIALGNDDHAGRADVVEPFLEEITDLTLSDGRYYTTARSVGDGKSG